MQSLLMEDNTEGQISLFIFGYMISLRKVFKERQVFS